MNQVFVLLNAPRLDGIAKNKTVRQKGVAFKARTGRKRFHGKVSRSKFEGAECSTSDKSHSGFAGRTRENKKRETRNGAEKGGSVFLKAKAAGIALFNAGSPEPRRL
jgi:hypothetical protein